MRCVRTCMGSRVLLPAFASKGTMSAGCSPTVQVAAPLSPPDTQNSCPALMVGGGCACQSSRILSKLASHAGLATNAPLWCCAFPVVLVVLTTVRLPCSVADVMPDVAVEAVNP